MSDITFVGAIDPSKVYNLDDISGDCVFDSADWQQMSISAVDTQSEIDMIKAELKETRELLNKVLTLLAV